MEAGSASHDLADYVIGCNVCAYRYNRRDTTSIYTDSPGLQRYERPFPRKEFPQVRDSHPRQVEHPPLQELLLLLLLGQELLLLLLLNGTLVYIEKKIKMDRVGVTIDTVRSCFTSYN